MKRLKGFTLVELVIVIAIVIILSVVSVPIYRGYMDRAKYAEGYALLGTILSAQKAYFSEHGYFYRSSLLAPSHPGIGINALGNKYFTLFAPGGIGGSGTTETDVASYYFRAGVVKPEDLRKNGNVNSILELDFNLTLNARYRDGTTW